MFLQKILFLFLISTALPSEVLDLIFGCLSSEQLAIASCVSHAWNLFASKDALWKPFCAVTLFHPSPMREAVDLPMYKLLSQTRKETFMEMQVERFRRD